MQRFIISRYFLFGLALCAMWLIGKGRATVSPSTNSAATTDTGGFAPMIVDGPQLVSANAVEDEIQQSDLLTVEPVAQQQSPASLNAIESIAEIEVADADLADSIELDSMLSESDDSFGEIAPERVARLDDWSADALTHQLTHGETSTPMVSANDTSVGNQFQAANQITNRYFASSDPNDEVNSPAGGWSKNPFANQTLDGEQLRSSTAPQSSATQNEGSILESFGASSGFDKGKSAVEVTRVGLNRNLEIGLAKPDSVDQVEAPLSEAVAQGAAHHIEYGKSLSRRGAAFAARQEFFSALGMIAQNHDARQGGNDRSTALRRGVQAIREAGDFLMDDAENQIGMNVRHVVETHATQIIGELEAEQMVPVEAMQRYFGFAQQQLAFAGGKNVVSAEALFCLGKLHSVMAQHQPERLDVAKAIVFHRAALENDQNNFRSANELGVLLARSGQLEQSRDLLKQSLIIRPATQAWQNLAKVHQRLGEQQLSQLAATESAMSAQQDMAVMNSAPIRWLAKREFNALAPVDFHATTASSKDRVVPATGIEAIAEKSKDDGEDKESFVEKVKSWF